MMYRAALSIGLASAFFLSSAGCGLLLDPGGAPDTGTLPDVDAGGGMDGGPGEAGRVDAGPIDAALDTLMGRADAGPVDQGDPTDPPPTCEGLPDRTPCGRGAVQRQICRGGDCVASWCGDGFVDTAAGEQCDDGDGYDFDQCGNDCNWACAANADCDDGRPCNGAEWCNGHRCRPGDPPVSMTMCEDAAGRSGTCAAAGYCSAVGIPTDACGDGVLNPGEQCDDANNVAGDGCEPDCYLTCETAADCASSPVSVDDPCLPTVCGPSHTCELMAASTDFACYDDSDRDGFGAGAPYFVCGTRCPDRTTPISGDCDDNDSRAHPGTTLYYAQERTGAVGGWDFDCDGAVIRYGGRGVYSACTMTLSGCTGSGWETAAPECGATGTYVTCGGTDTCTAMPQPDVQVRCH
ncbi:MAG: hypothetical protein JRH11_07570 [Deltaproteobacteria bacterium]|nr:hypothetical protein [Deltaproteobacteria bacterium]